jgi:hypothetical protein
VLWDIGSCGSGSSSTGAYRKFDTDKVKAQGQRVSGNRDAAAAVGLFNV